VRGQRLVAGETLLQLTCLFTALQSARNICFLVFSGAFGRVAYVPQDGDSDFFSLSPCRCRIAMNVTLPAGANLLPSRL
jgi:hypothetical protein